MTTSRQVGEQQLTPPRHKNNNSNRCKHTLKPMWCMEENATRGSSDKANPLSHHSALTCAAVFVLSASLMTPSVR